MKCKNCNTQINVFSLRCPYCQRQTFLGWLLQGNPSQEEREYNRTHNNPFLSPFVWNRVFNRILSFLMVIVVSLLAISFIDYQITEKRLEQFKTNNHDQILQTLETYYQNGQFDQMYNYLREKDLMYEKEYDDYYDAAHMSYYYDEYLNYKFQFLDMDDEEKEKHDYYLDSAIYYAIRTCDQDGDGEDLSRNNKVLFDQYKKEILSFFKGTCGFTEDEMEEILNSKKKSETSEKFAKIAIERKCWYVALD